MEGDEGFCLLEHKLRDELITEGSWIKEQNVTGQALVCKKHIEKVMVV